MDETKESDNLLTSSGGPNYHTLDEVERCSAPVGGHRRVRETFSKSMKEDLDDDEGDKTKRRLSLGDVPMRLHQDEQETHYVSFLLGRVGAQKVRVPDVAPSIVQAGVAGGSSTWKMPLDPFSSKKQGDVKHRNKRVRSYYKNQDELIAAYEDICMEAVDEVQVDSVQDNYGKAVLFSKLTLLINLLLLIAKAVASALSGSIAIISSLVDSCLDLFSGTIMWWATRAVKQRDPYNYPQGRTRLEPLAVIILSVVMSLCSLQLIRESIEKIIDLSGMGSSLPNVDYITITITGSTVVVKFILWLVCRKINSSVVQALAQDHRNDVLSNLVAIICGYLGSKNFMNITDIYDFAYVDPAGAILISLYIMYNWWQTGSEQIKMLTGHTADPSFISKLTWVCMNHHPQVLKIDTVRAFHFGSNFLVEVDIILPDEMPLREAHDIGESLQHRLERLPEVERAFVHLDFEFTHNPLLEHKCV